MASRNDLDQLTAGEKRARLKQLLERGGAGPTPPNAVLDAGPVRRPEHEAPVPSFAQERMWFLHQLEPTSAAYNVQRAVELSGAVDVQVLEAALRQLLARHKALRSVFPASEGRPGLAFQEVPRHVLEVEELSEAVLARRLLEESARPFSLEQGPLYRFRLLRLSPERHVFLLVLHHLVVDGWSLNLLMRELGSLYTALGRQEVPQLPALALEYTDIAAWQRTPGAAAREASHLEYWKRQLADAPALLELPTDKPRPANRSGRGTQTRPLLLPAALSEKVRAFCREHQVTPFMAFYTVFAALLHRYSQQTDLCVGTPVAGRTHLSTEGVVGLFVNTVVLRNNITPATPFSTLLSQVRETAVAAYAHQEAPFERVVDALQVERSLGWTPLFQVMFDLYQEERSLADALSGLGARPVEVDTGTTQFDLGLTVVESAAGFSLLVPYSTELFEASSIQRLLGHYLRLLEHALEAPRTPVGELRLLSSAEREQVLHAFNDTERPFDSEATIVSLFEAQVARTPDAPAVVAPEGTLTFRELATQASRLAAHLVAAGAGPEAVVGLCLERSLDAVVSLLAIFMSGAGCLPLEASHPAARRAALLRQSGARLVVTRPGLFADVALDVPVVTPDVRTRDAVPTAPPVKARAEHLAYLLYTSGSTGEPKGVELTHRNVVHCFAAFDPYYETQAGDCWASSGSLSFDIHLEELLFSITRGARTVLREVGPLGLGRDIVRHGITHIVIMPSSLATALEEPGALEAIRSLKVLVSGGEVLPEPLVRQLALTRTKLINTYGPTETSINVVAERTPSTGPVRLGRPLDRCRVYVLDERGEPVPVGIPGELFIGGTPLGRGYRSRPDLTAERFVPDPFSRVSGARLYRTGDRVRWNEDGTLSFLGRTDFQVKVRGVRIELEEIEASLLRQPGVRQAAVVVRGSGRDTRLEAFLVLEGEAGTVAKRLREALRLTLPEAMVPSRFVALPSLPFTTSGKVDRKALAALPVEDAAQAPQGQPPRGPVEELLAQLFCQVLGLEQVQREDDFFQLGGHSLSATRLVARIRQAFGVELPLSALFSSPSVAGLARAVSSLQGSTSVELSAPTPRPSGAQPVLSFAQERMWFLQQLQPDSSAYHVAEAVELTGEVRPAALEEALRLLLSRHPALRTTFSSHEGRPQPHLQPLPSRVLHVESSSDSLLPSRLRQEVERPFSLEHGPLFRFFLWQVEPQRHVLLLVFHHLLVDGLSLALLLRELGEAHASLLQGQQPSLPPVRLDYSDIASWQRSPSVQAREDSQLSFWKQYLDGAPRLLQLPTDRPRPPVSSGKGGSTPRLPLSPSLSRALGSLCRQHQVTPFMALFSAFASLLHRYCGQDDVCVGTPVGGRTHPSTEDVVGLFTNTLVLRSRLAPASSFSSLLSHVRASSLEAFSHQDVPFDRLVSHLGVERSPSHSPLFQAAFAWNHPVRPLAEDLPGLTARYLALPAAGAKFDLALAVHETASGLELELEYSADLFEPSTAQRLLGHYVQLLSHALTAPDTRVDSLRLLSEEEQHFVLRACNETHRPEQEQATVVSLLSAHAQRTPYKVALAFEGGQWTYAELDAHTNRAARELAAQGVGPESLVALVGPRTEATLRAILSLHKAGGAFLPLESRLPPARIAQVLAESRAPFALALGGADALLEQALALLPAHQRPRVLSLEGRETRSSEAPPRRDSPGSLAYVLFTSGSTGVPKGVMIDQRGMLNHILGMQQALGLGSEDVIAQTAALSFDISVWQMLAAFALGATTEFFQDELVREPARLAEALDSAGVTTVQLVPSVLQSMLEDGAGQSLPAFGQLRRMVTIGEALPPAVCRAWFERYPSIPLHNAYGPAECSDTATVHPMREAPAGASTPIGTPKANMEVYVLDEALQPVPVGVVGELYIGGVGVGRGYLNRPELTAERFVPHPFSTRPGARLYRTGDLGRRLAGGQLEFVARADFQVKVRGMRIELAEIESALLQQAPVRSAVVMARERRQGDKYLVAFVVPAGSGASEGSLQDALARTLPAYMVPSRIVLLEALPLSPNGKVDRKALAALPVELSAPASQGQPPRGPVEELLAQLFCQVLGLEQVQREDDFFQLGGHSLSATRLVARIRQAFGVELPLSALFSSPSVAGLARAVSSLQGSPSVELSAPTPRPSGAQPVLSFAQERMWFLQQLQPDSSAYHVAEAVELTGEVRPSVLEEALRLLLTRHPALRTTFSSHEGRPQPHLQPLPSRVLHVESTSDSLLPSRLRQEVERPFSLEHGPLFRFFLWQVEPQRHVLLLVFHHLLVDGLSLALLLRELGEAHASLLQSQQPALPPVRLDYSDIASWQRSPSVQAREDSQLSFWKQYLDGAPRLLQLPTDRPRPPVSSGKGGSTPRLPLSPSLSRALGSLCRQHQVTPFMALFSAFASLLHRYCGQDDVCVGTPVGGRTHPSTEDVVGLFTNTLVLRSRLAPSSSFASLLSHVRASSLEAFSHQDVPFDRLVSHLGVERSPSHSPLFQAAFTWNRVGNALAEAMTGLTARTLSVSATAAKFDLALVVHETGSELELEVEYSADLFEPATARQLLEQYLQLLSHALRAPDTRVDALHLLSDEERERMVRGFSAPQRPFDTRATVVSLFEAQVARAPEAQALAARDGALSYRQLDEQATALAHHLTTLGAGPETVIGVCLERTSELLVSLLAILKAGAAYLPLEGSHPLARRTALLRGAGARLVVARPESFPEELPGIVRVAPEARSPGAPLRPPAPDQLALVLFTSGTTGEPKAVEVTHRNLCHLFEAADTSYPSRPGDTTLAAASVAFDVHVVELLYPLARGARVVLRETGPLGLARDISQHRATHLLGTPSVVTAALEEPNATDAFRRLAFLQLGGEAPPEPLVQRLSGGRVQVLNGYGPSETTCITTLHPLRPGAPIRLGRPLERVRPYVLDAHGQPAAPGMPGELYIGGEGVSRGYRGRPELTAERFVPDPFSGIPGARLYRTGDRVKWNADGTLSFLGRVDLQVKVRGMRIELEEIEAALLRQPGVRQAAVLARQGERESRLEAFVATEGDASHAEETLRGALASVLPAAMVPSRIIVLDALPLSSTGKVDRQALAALPVAAPEPRPAGEPPRGPMETLVAELFQRVLGAGQVGREDNFFELGGHSMGAARLVAQLRRAFGVEVPLSAVFAEPTVAGLAARLGTAPRLREELQPGPRPERIPASLVQERLWFALQLPDAPPYSIVMPLVLEGALELAKLEAALAAVVEANETLRTTFFLEGETVFARVGAASGPVLARTDLSHLPPEQALEEARRAVTRHDGQPFDVRHGPVYRFELLRLDAAGTKHVLIAAASHLVIDGLGLQALLGELAVAYRAALEGQPSLLTPAPVQYADFVLWQRSAEHQRWLEESLETWKQALRSAPPVLDLPLDFPRRAPAINANMRPVPLSLGGADVAALRELARREGVSVFTAVVALMQAWLHRLSAQTHVVVASPVSGRPLPQTEHMVGYFTNVLPLCTDFSNDPSFRALLKRVHEVVGHASAHQELPFKRIADAAQPDASRTAPPLAQALLQLDSLSAPAMEGLTTTLLDVGGIIPAYDVVLSVIERAGGALDGILATDSALFTPATAARMAGALEQLLAEAVRLPDAPLSRLSLLSARQRAQVLASLDGGPQPVPEGACVHTLFEAQVRRTPEAPAVAHGFTTWSYAELNARANLLASKLIAQGLRPEERVGVVMEPSAQALAVLLGILKAGGAYVPLDPGWPEQRKRSVLERAGVWRLWVDPALLAEHHGLVPLVEVPPQPARVEEDLGPGPRGVSDAQLAYLIFTSGSTGEPKGVMVEHRSVVNHNLAIAARFGLRPGDRMLQFAPLSFDAAAEDLYPPLAVGATVVMRSGLVPAHAMTPHLEELGITIISLPPTYIEEWVREMEAQGQRVPSRLRLLAPGGDVLKRETYEGWLYVGGMHAPWVNVYGPTECTITSATCDIPGEEGVGTAPTFPIGRPIPRVRFYLLDERFEPVLPGLPGKVYIGGAALSRGYLDAPHMTAERFVPDPFAAEPGARMYHTGDLARLLPDGRLRFLGRADHQVKIRGFRIELSEIENCLRRFSRVEEAVVVARTSAAGVQQLCAYVQTPEPVQTDALRAHVAEQLPSYMVPAAFVVMERLPLNNNGKVDRHALPEPEVATAAAPAPASGAEVKLETPFRSTLELRMLRLWSDVLNLPHIKPEDDFFMLGGDSILAMRLLGRMEEEFGVPVPLATIFQAPILKQTVDALRELLEEGPPRSSVVRLSGPDVPDNAPAVFLLHPSDGELHHYRFLTPLLEPRLRCFGIQAPETVSRSALGSFEERIAAYARDIQAVQPHGPYRILGYSYGGYPALGVAAALEAAGEEVRLLAMLDTITFEAMGGSAPVGVAPPLIIAEEFDVLDEALERELAALPLAEQWNRVAERARAKGTAASHFEGGDLARMWHILGEVLVPQVRAWTVPQVRARLQLFRAEAAPVQDETLGWSAHLPRESIDVVRVPGNHFGVVQPPVVDEVAKRLLAGLDE
ncbi:amino acid adenylation domain-containing protein [Archangium gephyra]|uniref:amino acid adenylation domain-containing protein n=1 Tax=Archangium gephyra TaxID=48 RepID=UPI0035D4CFF7